MINNIFRPVPNPFLLFTLFVLLAINPIFAQQSAVDYLHTISNEFNLITNANMTYMSAVSHSKRAKKIENKRKEVIEQIKSSQKKISRMQSFKGDATLKDSTVALLQIYYHVLNDDFSKIVDLQEIAENSYDDMEAYLAAEEAANKRLSETADRFDIAYRDFAKKNEITLIDTEDQLSKKMKAASEVFHYKKPIYLLFFKCFKQEGYLIHAMNNNNLADLEQNREALISTSKECIEKLKEIQSYKGDFDLKNKTLAFFNFCQLEANELKVAIDVIQSNENLQKSRKALDAKGNKATKEDIDAYNKLNGEHNKLIEKYNSVNNKMNAERAKKINDYNEAEQRLLSKYVPKHK